MVHRHFAWFDTETGGYMGEWTGRVPAPVVPPSVTGEARVVLLNAWLHQVQSVITPSGSPYETDAEAWDLRAWDACPNGGAVCLDVTMYRWPCGDFVYAVFDGVDRLLDFREMRTYLQVTPLLATLDATVRSARPIRSTAQKLIADVTGTPLEPFAGQLFGRFVRQGGRLVFEPTMPGLPEAVVLSLTDRNDDLAPMLRLDREAVRRAERRA